MTNNKDQQTADMDEPSGIELAMHAQNQNQTDPDYVPRATGCCGVFRYELGLGWFEMVPSANGRKLDLDASFCVATTTNWLVKLSKIVFLGVMISSLVIGIIDNAHPNFYLAYLTHWSLIVSIGYQVLSTSLSLFPFSSATPVCLLRATWILFTVAVNAEILVTFLFWFLEYGPSYSLQYKTIVNHGGVAVLLLLDGLFVNNRIPVRLSHWTLSFLYMVLYSVWTLVQQLALHYNPYDDDDDDAIYDALAWRKNAKKAGILLVLVIFVASPVLHLLLWALSLRGRRYKTEQ